MDTSPPPYPGPDAHDAGAVLAAPPSLACTRCTAPLPDDYHMADGRVICGRCRAAIEAQAPKPDTAGGFSRALMRGLGVAAVCAIAYAGFMIATDWEVALLTIGIGWAVGTAVKKGAGHLAGRPYQFLALALTWFSLGGAYAGLMLYGIVSEPTVEETGALPADPALPPVAADEAAPVEPAPSADAVPPTDAAAAEGDGELSAAGLGAAAVLGFAGIALMAVAAPVLIAVQSPLSGLITAFGLYQSWRQSVPDEVPHVPVMTGPHRVAGGAYVPPPPPPPPV